MLRRLVAGFPSRRSGFGPILGDAGVCGGRSGVSASIFPVLQFPLPIIIPSNAPYSLSGSGTVYVQ